MKTGTKKRMSPFAIIIFSVLILYTISIFMPLFWGFFTSLKTNADFRVNVSGLPKGMPWEWNWGNYPYVFNNFFVIISKGGVRREVYFYEMLLNSILYAGGGAFFATFTPCIIAYLVAKFPYKFSKIIYNVVIVVMVLPIIGALPSEIKMTHLLGIYDTMIGQYIMKANFLGTYFLVFCANYKTISKEFSEAAYVDGASNLTTYFLIIFPIISNAFVTIFIINFISLWNDYQTPLIYIPSIPTASLGVFLLNFSATNAMSWPPLKITSSIIMLIPIMIMFFIFHKRIIGNLTMGGIKG